MPGPLSMVNIVSSLIEESTNSEAGKILPFRYVNSRSKFPSIHLSLHQHMKLFSQVTPHTSQAFSRKPVGAADVDPDVEVGGGLDD